MKLFLLFTLLLLSGTLPMVKAQPVISQQVFAVAGHSYNSDAVQFSGTLGETFIYGGSIDDFSGCQGFQSGTGVITTKVIDHESIQLNLQYFPNPTREGVTLRWDEEKDFVFELRNSLGQTLTSQSSPAGQRELYFDLQGYAPGAYALFIHDHSSRPVFAGWVMYLPN